MRTILLLAVLLLGAGVSSAQPEQPLVYDFEKGTDGWTIDWGLKQNPSQATDRARQGTGSLALAHEFKKTQETLGVHVLFPEPRDFGAVPGFEGFSAWIYIPKGGGWQAQFYYHVGEDWEWHDGPLYQDLQPGWHQILLRRKELGENTVFLDLGIQIKNYRFNQPTTINVDRVEVLRSSK